MAVAEIIGAAIGTMLLIIVAYLLVGNVLSTAEVVSNAQKDMTLLEATRLNTDIRITNVSIAGSTINFTVNNTGNDIIRDFLHAEVFVHAPGDTTGFQDYNYNAIDPGPPGTWTKSIIDDSLHVHPGELGPEESMFVNVYFIGATPPTGSDVIFCTNNGVYASAHVI